MVWTSSEKGNAGLCLLDARDCIIRDNIVDILLTEVLAALHKCAMLQKFCAGHYNVTCIKSTGNNDE